MHNVRAMNANGFNAFRGLLTRVLLVVALLLAGVVPDGMMREAGPDGVRLVLCTGDGTQEVWLADDGTTIPVDDEERSGSHASHCIQVNLITQTASVQDGLPVHDLSASEMLVGQGHQLLARQTSSNAHRSRAPPYFL